jgi:succinate--hydroxymethylglutarate CoA-transferase
VNNIEQTFQHPQVKDRELVKEIEHSSVGQIKVVGPPIKYSVSQPSIRIPPPLLGQHTEEVLKELGYSDSDIQHLRVRGVVTTGLT